MKKSLRAGAALLAVMTLFVGCSSFGKPDETSGGSGSDRTSGTYTGRENDTGNTDGTGQIPEEPLELTTPGGASLSGSSAAMTTDGCLPQSGLSICR